MPAAPSPGNCCVCRRPAVPSAVLTGLKAQCERLTKQQQLAQLADFGLDWA